MKYQGLLKNRMIKDPRLWDEYHRQYRESLNTWSVIPYQEIIKKISKMPKRLHIGDFGCGEAKVLEAFPDRIVHSFDYVAINDNVTACDMKKVLLDDEELDIAIFSLSLMGRNWIDYLEEAQRCLATNGYLFIAETTKSLKGRLSRLLDILKQKGFEIDSDEERGDFTFIEARKSKTPTTIKYYITEFIGEWKERVKSIVCLIEIMTAQL